MLAVVENIIVQVEAVDKSQEVGRYWKGLFRELEGSQRGWRWITIRSWAAEVTL